MKRILLVILLLFAFGEANAATTAKQVDFLLAGYRHPTTDAVLSGGKVKTFLTGTSSLSSCWTDRAKGGVAANPVVLDSTGKAEIYCDNIYKFEIYDSGDVLLETISGLKYTTSDSAASSSFFSLISISSPADGQVATVSSFYGDGGGGGGDFYWQASCNESTADGGSIVDPDNIGTWDGTQASLAAQYYGASGQGTGSSTGCWIRIKTPGNIDAFQYGASGDGTDDDTKAIQEALDSGEKNLSLSDGTYIVEPLTMTTAINIIGEGGILKAKSTSTTHVLTLTSVDGVTIDGLIIDGNRAAVGGGGGGGNGIHTVNCDRLNIINGKVHDVANIGIVARGGANINISFNIVYDCVFNHIVANSVDDAMTDVALNNNQVYVTAFGINTGNGGMALSAAANSITRATVNNNVVTLPISASAPAAQICITVFQNVNQYTVDGNSLSGGKMGVSTSTIGGVITNNAIFQPDGIGVEVATGGAFDSSKTVIAGNNITGSDSGGTTKTKGIAVTSSAASSSATLVNITGNFVKDSFLPIQVSETSSGSVNNVMLNDNYIVMSSTNSRVELNEVEELSIKNNHVDLNGQTTAKGFVLNDCDKFAIESNFIYGAIAGGTGISLNGTAVDITYGTIKNNSYEGDGTAVSFAGYIRYTGDANTVDVTGTLEVENNVGQIPVNRDSDDGNPAASQGDSILLAGSSAITDIIQGYVGKEITIRSTATSTITDNAALKLAGGVNYVMAASDTLMLKMFTAGVWTEISRSVN